MISLRMNRLIYPDFETWVYVDRGTYEGFKALFDSLTDSNICKVFIREPAPLCEAMLWRMIPAFNPDVEVVLCRDLDSPVTMRERKCVEYWLGSTKCAHAITDSVSHNIPMLGGMIGFRGKNLRERLGVEIFEAMLSKWSGMDFSRKGSDQDFINRHIYPVLSQYGSDSITQHYLLGMPNTYLSDYRNTVPDITVPIPEEMRESNDVCGHIGAAGWYETALHKFLHKYYNKFDDIRRCEATYPDAFYWLNENIF